MELEYELEVMQCEFCKRVFLGDENNVFHNDKIVYCGLGIDCLLTTVERIEGEKTDMQVCEDVILPNANEKKRRIWRGVKCK